MRRMIKTGMWPVIALGLITALLRAFGPASVADMAAIGYLMAATVAFGRPRPMTGQMLHPVPPRASFSRRHSPE